MKSNDVYVYVDGTNEIISTQEVYGADARLDYTPLVNYARTLGNLAACRYFGYHGGDGSDMGFRLALRHKGFGEVTVRPIHRSPFGDKGNADSEMSFTIGEDTALKRPHAIVIASGDVDFVPIVERLRHRGIFTCVVGPDKRTAPELIIAADKFFHTSQLCMVVRAVAIPTNVALAPITAQPTTAVVRADPRNGSRW